MNLQQILSSVPGDRIDRYLQIVRDALPEEDLRLVESMLLDGLSPWQAANSQAKILGKPISTVFARSRLLAREIHSHFGYSVDSIVERLTEGETVSCPGYLMEQIQRSLRKLGNTKRISSTVSLRLVDEGEDDGSPHGEESGGER